MSRINFISENETEKFEVTPCEITMENLDYAELPPPTRFSIDEAEEYWELIRNESDKIH